MACKRHCYFCTYTWGGDLKITGIIFLKWFIRFYTITTLVSFKVLSFWLDTLVPMFSPLLKTFLELFSADVVQDLQHFLFHFTDINKTLPFHPVFHRREQEKVAWHNVRWIWRIRFNRHVVFCQKLLHTHKAVWAGALSWWRNQSLVLHISGRFFRTISRNLFNTFK